VISLLVAENQLLVIGLLSRGGAGFNPGIASLSVSCSSRAAFVNAHRDVGTALSFALGGISTSLDETEDTEPYGPNKFESTEM